MPRRRAELSPTGMRDDSTSHRNTPGGILAVCIGADEQPQGPGRFAGNALPGALLEAVQHARARGRSAGEAGDSDFRQKARLAVHFVLEIANQPPYAVQRVLISGVLSSAQKHVSGSSLDLPSRLL